MKQNLKIKVEAGQMAHFSKKIIEKNGFENVIQVNFFYFLFFFIFIFNFLKVINSKIEEVELEEKVDVLISEWIGLFFILFYLFILFYYFILLFIFIFCFFYLLFYFYFLIIIFFYFYFLFFN